MRLFLLILFASVLSFAGVATYADDAANTTPHAAAPESGVAKPAPEPDTSEQRGGKLWVCCDDGRSRWTATNEVCRARGGQLLPGRFCEKPRYVCCKQGRAEWWMPSADACHEDGGIVADKSYCR
jgi:hypothetical protein